MPGDLTPIERARELVLERVPRPAAPQPVPLPDALGRILGEDVTAADPVPPFDCSAMDGFAVRAADTAAAGGEGGVGLGVVGESRAGHPAAQALQSGEAITISTGAVIPAGADAVVRVEDTRPPAETGDGRVEVLVAVDPGRDIRRAGEDIERGEAVLRAGTRLGFAELGVLGSVGADPVPCAPRPSLAVIVSGDELVSPAEIPGPGMIRDSNALTVPALAKSAGAAVSAPARARDDPGSTREAIAAALGSEVVVICGGVSVGEHDHVKPALAELGVEEVFWGTALRPGRPTWFGVAPAGALVFGLPGNPVSAVVTFLLLVRPALIAMQGGDEAAARTTASFDADYAKRPGRAHALRVRLELREDGWHATPTKEQGSHILTSMLDADALAMIPTEKGDVQAGERVEIEMLPKS